MALDESIDRGFADRCILELDNRRRERRRKRLRGSRCLLVSSLADLLEVSWIGPVSERTIKLTLEKQLVS